MVRGGRGKIPQPKSTTGIRVVRCGLALAGTTRINSSPNGAAQTGGYASSRRLEGKIGAANKWNGPLRWSAPPHSKGMARHVCLMLPANLFRLYKYKITTIGRVSQVSHVTTN